MLGTWAPCCEAAGSRTIASRSALPWPPGHDLRPFAPRSALLCVSWRLIGLSGRIAAAVARWHTVNGRQRAAGVRRSAPRSARNAGQSGGQCCWVLRRAALRRVGRPGRKPSVTPYRHQFSLDSGQYWTPSSFNHCIMFRLSKKASLS